MPRNGQNKKKQTTNQAIRKTTQLHNTRKNQNTSNKMREKRRKAGYRHFWACSSANPEH
ncbi:MAG: hypothetical protein J6A11_03590 [Lachnospiraceae bacterium]|nr:hypothetical protein [Lachnospiraceae bacterium]